MVAMVSRATAIVLARIMRQSSWILATKPFIVMLLRALAHHCWSNPALQWHGRERFSFLHWTGRIVRRSRRPRPAGTGILNYDAFLNQVISFVIVAAVVFVLVERVNRLKRKEDTSSTAPTRRSRPYCLMSISIKATRYPHYTSDQPVRGD